MSEDKKIIGDLGKVIGVLVLIAVVISVIAMSLVSDDDAARAAWEEKQVLNRIKPLGELATTTEEAQKASPVLAEPEPIVAEPMTAKQVYNTACMACHTTGAAGAPKIGDIAEWEFRIAQGNDVLFEHATKGFKGMPPRGGSSQLTDEDVQAAISFMVNNSQ
ncbi:MAG: cytochrome c, class I [Cycloclasticus sp. symbiont of Bathymodiolus heckerae]|nr:MAG: cytochrome c, class I [Cycloclasticus sp. symbiont of Bathymodiolus heckerae]